MARKMKDSGIEWIGEIPEGWSKNKVIRLFDIIGSGTTPKNITSDFPVVNWIQSGDITGSFVSACKNVISANLLSQYSALKVYPAPFIIIAMYGASVGNASISLIDGCVNQACCVLSSPSCNLHYAFYVIKSAQSYLVRKAVGGGQPNISQETIKQLWLPLPPLSTQDIIVRNLDATCSKIDDLLTSVHASIEEYKKLKQAVITQAVTKGMRGEREMKDSGVEWIGKIPKEWKKNKILRIFSTIGSGTTPKSTDNNNFDGNINWLQSGDINGNILKECKNRISFKVLSKYPALKLYHAPFIIIAMYGASIGNLSISIIDGCVNQACCVFSHTSQNFQYMFYCLKTVQPYLIRKAVGGGQPNVSQEILKSLWVPLPPLDEQKEIANYLDAKCAEIDKLIAKKEQLIKELESYKKSLIYEVVTGKREV